MKKNDNIPLNYKEKSNSRISFIVSVVVLIVLCVIFNQLDYNLIRRPAQDAKKAADSQKQKEEEQAQIPQVSSVSVVAVGDNLYHNSLIESGQSESGAWNYDHLYANILDEIQSADIAMVSQETVLTTDHNSVSSYPTFATPSEAGSALAKAGFNVISAASNHVDDFGYDLMMQTLDFWKTNYPDTTLLGLHDTPEDADTIKIVEINDIKLAFLNYTYGTNNSGGGEGKEYMIDLLDTAKAAADIQKAKAASDCVIVSAHWGREDEPMPTEYQKQWANFLMKQGVDVVIGAHPHVLQPYGRMMDDEGHNMLIFYSLGNFVSGQEGLKQLLGGMGKFTVEKTISDGVTSVKVTAPELKPMVMHYNWYDGEYAAYMLEDYTEELASQHSVREIIGDEFSLSNLKTKFDEIMSMKVKPATKSNLLDVSFDSNGNMVDKDGNIIEDTDSITSVEYYQNLSSSGNSSREESIQESEE